MVMVTVLFMAGGRTADPKSVRRCNELSQRPKQRSRPKTYPSISFAVEIMRLRVTLVTKEIGESEGGVTNTTKFRTLKIYIRDSQVIVFQEFDKLLSQYFKALSMK